MGYCTHPQISGPDMHPSFGVDDHQNKYKAAVIVDGTRGAQRVTTRYWFGCVLFEAKSSPAK